MDHHENHHYEKTNYVVHTFFVQTYHPKTNYGNFDRKAAKKLCTRGILLLSRFLHRFPYLREWKFNFSTMWTGIELEQGEGHVRLGFQESLHREAEENSLVGRRRYQVKCK